MLRYEFDSHAERTGIASLMRRLSELGIAYKDLSTHQSSLEDIFVELVHEQREGARMNWHGIAAIYRFEMARWKRTLVAEPDHAGDHHLALFRRVRLGARLPDDANGRRQLRRLHRARADAALGVHAIDLQRQLRHLFSEVYGHDLRIAVSPDLKLRGGARLCRRGGDQVGDPGARHTRHRHLFVPVRDRSPARDDPVPRRHQRPASACSASPSASGRRISSSFRSSRC